MARQMTKNYMLLGYVLPVVAYIICFKFIPYLGNIIAFQDYKLLSGILNSDFIGLKNFSRLFQSQLFWNAFRNTLMLNGLSIAVGFPFTILLSLALVEIHRSARRVLQICLYIPYFISWASLGGIIVQLLSPSIGVVGAIGELFKLSHSELPYLMGHESSWVAIYVMSSIWQSAGWGTIVFVAAIMNIDSDSYRFADSIGASSMQKTRYITLPAIWPVVSIMFLLKMSSIVSTDFEHIYALSNSMVLSVSDVLSTFEYRVGLQSMQFSYATAVGLFEGIFSIIVVFVINRWINNTRRE